MEPDYLKAQEELAEQNRKGYALMPPATPEEFMAQYDRLKKQDMQRQGKQS